MKILLIRLTVFLSILLISNAASAAIAPSGVLDEVASKFLIESSGWATKITAYATWLFWTLATISMVWTFGFMALRKADIGEFFAEFLRFTITTGFFWWLLSNGPAMALSIIDSLRTIGAEAGGLPRELTPSRPIDIAFNIIAKAGKSYSITSPMDNLSIFLTTLAILACMAVVAANVLLALVNAWVLAYAGIFVLGFGGSRWTSDIAMNYFRSVTGIALKLMTMTLLIGVAISIMDGYHADLAEGASIRELLVIFVVSLVLVVLIHSIPNMIAGLIPGGGAAASAGSSFSAGAIAGAAVGAAAAAASGGAALAAGATQAAGGASALMAAVQKASGAAESGGSSLAAALGGGSGGEGGGSSSLAEAMGDGASSSSSGGGSHGGTPAADLGGGGDSGSDAGGKGASEQAPGEQKSIGGMAAKAGKIAAGTVSNLVQGGVDSLKAKGASMRETAVDRIADTVGGKIASNIKASDGGNHLAPASDEVAAFANRK
jgi:P-type conjugative transfer protein TrbL